MNPRETYSGGENFDLRQILQRGKHLRLRERTEFFRLFLEDLESRQESTCLREIASPAGRSVFVIDPVTGAPAEMIMFGSNNYLGLADHPYVREKVRDAIRQFGVGIGGPPLLNGYTSLHRRLEERLAELKGTEDALIFSSGFGANVGLVAGLVNPGDTIFYDAYSHASFCDGLKLSGVEGVRFPHNDFDRLCRLFDLRGDEHPGDRFVAVEGVYSMDGDLAPLDRLVPFCRSHDAMLIVDDAHGTGVMGATGRGTAEEFGVEGEIDITMGTFSKAFGMTGGFIASSKPVISYLRYFARPYMFSASLPPLTIAAVLAGLDVMRSEPELLAALRRNVARVGEGLRKLGFDLHPQTPIVPLRVPVDMNIRSAAYEFHKRGIFVNSVEYPAVPISQQRFRVSIMSLHTQDDIDRLLAAIDDIWHDDRLRVREAAGTPMHDEAEVL